MLTEQFVQHIVSGCIHEFLRSFHAPGSLIKAGQDSRNCCAADIRNLIGNRFLRIRINLWQWLIAKLIPDFLNEIDSHKLWILYTEMKKESCHCGLCT